MYGGQNYGFLKERCRKLVGVLTLAWVLPEFLSHPGLFFSGIFIGIIFLEKNVKIRLLINVQTVH